MINKDIISLPGTRPVTVEDMIFTSVIFSLYTPRERKRLERRSVALRKRGL